MWDVVLTVMEETTWRASRGLPEIRKNSKNFRELQALDFVASLCALDRLHLETNGCGLGGVVGRSARHSDSILADLTRAEFENISRGPAVALVATLRD